MDKGGSNISLIFMIIFFKKLLTLLGIYSIIKIKIKGGNKNGKEYNDGRTESP